MNYSVDSFSTFRRSFTDRVPLATVKSAYINMILATLARCPGYVWAHKTEVKVSCRSPYASRAFTHGELTRKIYVQFGKVLGEDFWGW